MGYETNCQSSPIKVAEEHLLKIATKRMPPPYEERYVFDVIKLAGWDIKFGGNGEIISAINNGIRYDIDHVTMLKQNGYFAASLWYQSGRGNGKFCMKQHANCYFNFYDLVEKIMTMVYAGL